MKRGWHCHWVWTSFGLPPEYKIYVHDEIFSLCYYSNGGFTHTDVYQFPVYLRRLYLRKLTMVKQEEAKQQEAASKGNQMGSQKLSKPGINRPIPKK